MREIEQRGLYFDEFEEDVKYLHRPGRTVTEADNVFFTTLTMNTQALHLDAAWSEQQEFGQRLVNSMFTLSTVVGMSRCSACVFMVRVVKNTLSASVTVRPGRCRYFTSSSNSSK